MNTDIEKLLRKPPQFTPPAGLKERLIEQIPARKSTGVPTSGGWLRRWWPALAPAAVSIACAAVLAARQGEIRELRASNAALAQSTTEADRTKAGNAADVGPTDASAETQQEIDRLKGLASQLKSEIAQLSQLQTENAKYRAQLATPQDTGLTTEETEQLAKAKEKAQSIQCVNNLKQFGLAVRVWALDNNDSNPPDILSMSNELSTPKILVCPADTSRQPASDWSSFTMANCSYEFLVPNEKEPEREPNRVSVRCAIHGHIGLCDGSVQSKVAKDHPEQLVEQDGKLYFAVQSSADGGKASTSSQPNGSASAPQSNAGNPNEGQMRKFRERYGIWPTNEATPH
jgi:hypothetical protein